MKASSDKNPLVEVTDAILAEFIWFEDNKNNDWFPYLGKLLSDQENVLKLILQNNGCAFDDRAVVHFNTLECYDNYVLGFIWGGQANSINKYYDYIEFFNTKYLIIFMDFFLDIFNNPTPIVGRSNYFDAIKNIIDVFISTTTSAAELMGSLSTTAASNMYRFAGVFSAAKIIDEIVGLHEDDVSMIKYSDLIEMIDNIPIQLLMLGVKYME